ncbi:MAG: DUF975 family protein [Eubacteriales bacterium]
MDFSNLKLRAREALKGNWGIAIIASLIVGALGGGSSVNLNIDLSDFQGTPLEPLAEQFELFVEQNLGWLLAIIGSLAAIGFVVSVLTFCISSVVSTGYAKFDLDLVDRGEAKLGTLFSYFKNWKNLILTNLLYTLYVFLWSLLCIIPGIIAQYKYAMVPYILAEEPDLSPREALSRSEVMMQGHKLDLFLLNLSFIGWVILSVLSCGIGFIWLTPYVSATQTEFYREISGTGNATAEFYN